jgi:hypothetical protein
MLQSALIAGTLLVVAEPKPGIENTPTDYPQWALEQSKSAAALVELLIDPKGKVVNCKTLTTFEDSKLAKEICQIEAHKRWKAARLADGSSTYGLVRKFSKFFVPGDASADRVAALTHPFDIELFVNRLPGGASEVDVKVALVINPQGEIFECASTLAETPPALSDLVCKDQNLLDVKIEFGKSEQPIAYVTSRTVRLQLEPSKR